MPRPMAIKPQNNKAVPPSYRTKEKTLADTLVDFAKSLRWIAYGKMTSQLQMTVDPKPNIVMNLKFLYTSS